MVGKATYSSWKRFMVPGLLVRDGKAALAPTSDTSHVNLKIKGQRESQQAFD